MAMLVGVSIVEAARNKGMDSARGIPRHSVSGFSAGASVAVNHLVAYSASVQGLGIVGGSPYGCAILPDSANTCSGFASTGVHTENTTIPWAQFLGQCRDYLHTRAKRKLVDPLENLNGKPVYLFSGTDDVWVYPNVMKAVATQFGSLGAQVKTEFSLPAAHSWVVDRETCSQPGVQLPRSECCGWKNHSTACPLPPHAKPPSPLGCCGGCSYGDLTAWPVGWRPPINNCGSFDMAGEVLRWVRGGPLQKRAAVNSHNLHMFNQSQFLPAGWDNTASALLDNTGFVYIPGSCQGSAPAPKYSSQCDVHVHYHPCGGSWRDVSTSYMLQNALPAYAELNKLVIIYPQCSRSPNPVGEGCWDWSGAVGADFDTHTGVQLSTVINAMRGLREDTAHNK